VVDKERHKHGGNEIVFNKFIRLLKSRENNYPRWLTIVLPMFVLGAFFFALTYQNVYTETYDIERFDRARETIRSPITVENEVETQRKTRETIQAVADRYSIASEIIDERVEYIEEIFEAIASIETEHEVNNQPVDHAEDENELNQEHDEKEKLAPLTTEEKVQQLRQILSTEITQEIGENVLIQLVREPIEVREEAKNVLIESVTETLTNGVRRENIRSAIENVKQEIRYTSFHADLKDALSALAEFAVVENSFFDPDATAEARREAASNVDPVVIRAGEIIVREGQIITNEIYEELNLVGLLNNERNIYPIIGLGILILLLICGIGYEMNLLHKEKKLDKGKVISIIFISIIVGSLMKVTSLFTTQTNQLYFVVPVATGALLLKQLIHERIAIVLAILYAILGCIIFNAEIPGSLNVEAGIYFFFSQLAGIIFLVNVKDRLVIVKSGIGMIVVNILTVLLFVFLSFEKYSWLNLLILVSFAVVAAFLSAVLTLGLLPFFETSLGMISDIKLLSLANPNHPLLKKLLIEAPGTYHHSIMVANLSETACEAIGANGLLARVGAYYHDIGKTVRPHYFIENQLSNRNPHDVIAPKQSAEIIISHPYDGANMLKKHKMPKEIIDLALEHHGTSLLKYFYYKEEKNNKKLKESDFRYPGPKPQTKEAAILCICDSVEAAVRSLKNPDEQQIEDIVANIINDRLTDGQFDESPLTLKEIKTIHSTICETLKGIFHTRIQYPKKED